MKKLIYILFAITILTACSEDIELELSSTQSYLVVDGHLFDKSTKLNYVRLTSSTNYFSNQLSPAVSGASVIVSDGTNEYQFEERDTLGYYVPPVLFSVKQNCTYTLTVNVDFDNDGQSETYTATSSTPAAYEIDSVQCNYDKYFDAFKVGLFAHEDTETDNFYLFGVAVNDSLLSNTYTNLSKTTDKWFSSDYCWGATVYLFNNDDIEGRNVAIGDKVTMYAMNVNEDFYNYLSAIDDIANGSNPMFSSTPANAVGNISGGALGFFTVISVVGKDCYVTDIGKQ